MLKSFCFHLNSFVDTWRTRKQLLFSPRCFTEARHWILTSRNNGRPFKGSGHLDAPQSPLSSSTLPCCLNPPNQHLSSFSSCFFFFFLRVTKSEIKYSKLLKKLWRDSQAVFSHISVFEKNKCTDKYRTFYRSSGLKEEKKNWLIKQSKKWKDDKRYCSIILWDVKTVFFFWFLLSFPPICVCFAANSSAGKRVSSLPLTAR